MKKKSECPALILMPHKLSWPWPYDIFLYQWSYEPPKNITQSTVPSLNRGNVITGIFCHPYQKLLYSPGRLSLRGTGTYGI